MARVVSAYGCVKSTCFASDPRGSVESWFTGKDEVLRRALDYRFQTAFSWHVNFLLFHCHDLGRHLGCYGIPTVNSPNIDAFARDGVLFERYFCTAPQCSPSRASMFTGRYPHSNGVMGLCHGEFGWDLFASEKHIAQLLSAHGYRCSSIGVMHESRRAAPNLGMEKYGGGALAKDVVDSTIARLREHKATGEEFYIQAGIVEPHRLRTAPHLNQGFVGDHMLPDASKGVTVPGYILDDEGARNDAAELQGAVRHLDAEFGRLIEALNEMDLWKETVVIFTTDHGIAMPRAKCSLYEPGLEIALVMRLPAQAPAAGTRFTQMLSNVDLVPTLLELAQVPSPGNIQGNSFAPLLRNQQMDGRKEIFGEMTYHEYYDPIRSIRTERHKLHLFFTTAPAFMDCTQSWRPRAITKVPADPSSAYHPTMELYDLEVDPLEQKDLARDPAYEDVRRDLLKRLLRHLRETDDPILKGPIPGPQHAKSLEALLAAE